MNLLLSFYLFYYTNALSSFIKDYRPLDYDLGYIRTRRSIFDGENRKYLNISFQAFNKNFHLHLSEDSNIIHYNTKFFMGNEPYYINDMLPVTGTLNGYPASQVYGTVVDGVFRGVISENARNTSQEKWFIEHYGYYFKEYPGFHSVIYHDSHVVHNHTGCGWLEPSIKHKMQLMSAMQASPHNLYEKDSSARILKRRKRAAVPLSSSSRQYVCNLYLQSDTCLWKKVMSLAHVQNSRPLAMKEISSIFAHHVQAAQAIYQNTVFKKFNGRGNDYNGIGFRVDRVRINTTDDCERPELANSNPFCDTNIDVTNFLNLNSYVQHDDFCLAYVFTYRDFSGGTLGLAWVAEPGGSGGVCEKHRMMQEGSVNVRKSLNTGIVTLLNYGSYVALKVSQLTFAHEMGHNFGSKHDDDHKDHHECLPPVDDSKGNYIMFASATSGDKENNNKFSVCSKDSIARLLDRVTNSDGNCFLHQEGSFCGNKLTEDGEQCDCGYTTKDCNDLCCYPKESNSPCNLKKNVLISGRKRKVQCSPTAGECCTDECNFREKNHLCRAAGECYRAAYCQGSETKCPPSVKVKDLTKCEDNTRVCKNGECVGSICESVPGWQECSIIRSEEITPKMMCYVACKENRTNSPCISTFDLAKDTSLRLKYPQLVKELLTVDNKPIQLKPGAPCDNYHGYCDVFFICRSVEADGPLARIKNLIFNPKMMNKIRLWIIQYWWAVKLMCIGSIFFVAIFLKVCSYSTPATNPRYSAAAAATSHNLTPLNRRGPNHKHKQNKQQHQSDRICHHGSNHVAGSSRTNNDHVPAISSSSNNGGSSNNGSNKHHCHHHKKNGRCRHSRHHGNGDIPNKPSAPSILPFQKRRPPAVPPRPENRHNRPISMIQTNADISEVAVRPMSMNIESSIQIQQEIYRHNEPNYPPPAYQEVSPLVMIPEQHGRGKRSGHRSALNQQASRYN